jgi:hypothetical protein
LKLSLVGGANISGTAYHFKESDLSKYNLIKGTCSAAWGGRTMSFETYYPINFSYGGNYVAQAPGALIYNTMGTLQDESVGAPLQLLHMQTQELYPNISWHMKY